MTDELEDDESDDGAPSPDLVEDETDLALLAAEPPQEILDLAKACVGFVERAIGVRLDFTLETLPLLDHYLAGARNVLLGHEKAEVGAPSAELLAQAAGAYVGEVVRRRHPCWWRLAGEGLEPRLEFRRVYLSVAPVTLIHEALALHPDHGAPALGGMELDDRDRRAAGARLAELPEVSEEEYVAPSTRVEVVDIVVDAARALRASKGEPALALTAQSYVH